MILGRLSFYWLYKLLQLDNCKDWIVIRNKGYITIFLVYGVILHHSQIVATVDMINNAHFVRFVTIICSIVVG
jgi:hypothetical protein